MTTIIVPVLNGAHVLPLTVGAVLAQPADRIVYVDDGSTDATPTLLANLARRDTRVEILRHAENRGRAASRNAGASGARGTLFFLDADVAPEAGYLDAMREALTAPEAIAAVGTLSFPDADPRDPYHRYLASSRRGPGNKMGADVSWRYFIAGVSAIRADALANAGGFPESIRYGEDLALACVLSRSAPRGLRHAPEAHAGMYDIGTLSTAREKLSGFARDLGAIREVCPDALRTGGFESLQPTSVHGRLAMAAAQWRAPAAVCTRLLAHVPTRLQPLAVRYLLGHTLVANARLDARPS